MGHRSLGHVGVASCHVGLLCMLWGVVWETYWHRDYVSASARWRFACWMYLPTVLSATSYFLAISV